MHLPTFLVPIRSFLLKECILNYPRSWLFWTHSCGEYFILYSLNPSISCGRSTTHSAAVSTNKWVGNCNSLLLVLYWRESVAERLSSQNHLSGQPHSVHHLGSLAAQRCWDVDSLWSPLLLYSSLWLCKFIKEKMAS